MAKKLDCLKRRNLLNSRTVSTEERIGYGREFMEDGLFSDALDFLGQADDREGLNALLPKIIAEGDVFLFTRLKKLLGQPATPQEWAALAEQAGRLGKATFAAQAERHLAEAGSESPADQDT